jgi:hypothetical protein
MSADSDEPAPEAPRDDGQRAPSPGVLVVGTGQGEVAAQRISDLFDGAARPPTIALLGLADTGKTFFFKRLSELAAGVGYKLTEKASERLGIVGGIEEFLGYGPEVVIDNTQKTTVWSLSSERAKVPELWIVDIQGEYFRLALQPSLAPVELIKMAVAPVLAASDALIVMAPAAQVLIPERTRQLAGAGKPGLKELVEAVVRLTRTMTLLRHAARGRNVSVAIDELRALSLDELTTKLDEAKGVSTTPLEILLSQADEYLKAGEDPHCDADPFLAAARIRNGAVINLLRAHFEFFRIDFVTACEGAERKKFDADKPSWGVWESVRWVRQTLHMRERKYLRWAVSTHHAIRLRRVLDPQFRALVPKGNI